MANLIENARGRRRVSMKPKELVNEEPEYPRRIALYNPDTLIGEVFDTVEEQEEALASGKWIKHPKMSLEEWLKKREETEDVGEKEEHVNWAERLKFRDANKPPVPSVNTKYVSQMNVAELIEKGKEVGVDFGTPETCPTKVQMRREIKKAETKQ